MKGLREIRGPFFTASVGGDGVLFEKGFPGMILAAQYARRSYSRLSG
jgi:hypothetical protein